MSATFSCDVRIPVKGYVTFVEHAPTPNQAKDALLNEFRLGSSEIVSAIERYIRNGRFEFSEVIDEGDQWTAEYSDCDCPPDY